MEKFFSWVWKRSAFILAICVITGLIAGWYLPATRDTVMVLAYCQIIMRLRCSDPRKPELCET